MYDGKRGKRASKAYYVYPDALENICKSKGHLIKYDGMSKKASQL